MHCREFSLYTMRACFFRWCGHLVMKAWFLSKLVARRYSCYRHIVGYLPWYLYQTVPQGSRKKCSFFSGPAKKALTSPPPLELSGHRIFFAASPRNSSAFQKQFLLFDQFKAFVQIERSHKSEFISSKRTIFPINMCATCSELSFK